MFFRFRDRNHIAPIVRLGAQGSELDAAEIGLLVQLARAHWIEHFAERATQLQHCDAFEQTLRSAARQTIDQIAASCAAGAELELAWQQFQHILFPNPDHGTAESEQSSVAETRSESGVLCHADNAIAKIGSNLPER